MLGNMWLLEVTDISIMYANHGYALATVGDVPAWHRLEGPETAGMVQRGVVICSECHASHTLTL